MVWEKAWQKEGERWDELKEENRFLDLINLTMEQPAYSIWWMLTDYDRQYVKQCEIMVKLLCHTSMLKSDDCRLRRKPFGSRMCNACDLASPEDARHMVMGCPAQTGYRTHMFDLIGAEYGNIREQVTFSTLLGEPIFLCINTDNRCGGWYIYIFFVTQDWSTSNFLLLGGFQLFGNE